MNFSELLTGVGKVTRLFHVLDERQSHTTVQVDALQKETMELRKELAALTVRVAVLEEGRKTTAAEVKLALVETISAWEIRKMREQIDRQTEP
jgi:hypothetical protein